MNNKLSLSLEANEIATRLQESVDQWVALNPAPTNLSLKVPMSSALGYTVADRLDLEVDEDYGTKVVVGNHTLVLERIAQERAEASPVVKATLTKFATAVRKEARQAVANIHLRKSTELRHILFNSGMGSSIENIGLVGLIDMYNKLTEMLANERRFTTTPVLARNWDSCYILLGDVTVGTVRHVFAETTEGEVESRFHFRLDPSSDNASAAKRRIYFAVSEEASTPLPTRTELPDLLAEVGTIYKDALVALQGRVEAQIAQRHATWSAVEGGFPLEVIQVVPTEKVA